MPGLAVPSQHAIAEVFSVPPARRPDTAANADSGKAPRFPSTRSFESPSQHITSHVVRQTVSLHRSLHLPFRTHPPPPQIPPAIANPELIPTLSLGKTFYTERSRSAASSTSSAPVYPERSRGAPTVYLSSFGSIHHNTVRFRTSHHAHVSEHSSSIK